MSVQYIPAPPVKEDASVYTFRELQDLTRALAEPQEVSYLQVLNVAPARPREGMVACADGTNWNPGEGPGFYGYLSGAWRILDETVATYTAASVTKNTGGTATGTVTNTTSMLDGTVYNVVETTGTPGFDIEFAWSGIVRTPTHLVLRVYYNGSATHNVTVDLYRYSGTPGWDKISTVLSALDYVTLVIALPTMTNYLSAGAAKVRLYHNSAGNASHDISIDYICLTNSGGSVASSNFILENRTSDPSTPVTGQIWLRTDL